MADQMIHEMIAAFAAGCMDKDNFKQFKEYLTAGGELPKGELGELQNIISMIPVILDLENPDAAIKDMVAKKLIGMKEEIKTKIIEGQKISVATKLKSNLYTKVEPKAPAPPPQNSLTFKTKNVSASAPPFTASEPTSMPASEEQKAHSAKEKIKTAASTPKTEEEFPKRLESIPAPSIVRTSANSNSGNFEEPEKVSSGAAGWISLLLTIILFTILGYFTYSSFDSMNRTIKDLQNDVTSMKSQLGTANNFISNYNYLIEFFNYKDITVVNLAGTDPAETASARVLLSFDEKEGLIQFKNAKKLSPREAFQLWAVNKGRSYSLGTYQPNDGEYLKLSSFPFLPKEQIEMFRITIEAKEGAAAEPKTNYLSGTFSGSGFKGRVN